MGAGILKGLKLIFLKRYILSFMGDKTMKNEKGASKWVLIFIIVLIIAVIIYWSKYFAKPMATVMMGGADQAQPAIEKAKQASDAMSRANRVAEEAVKKVNEDKVNEDKVNQDAGK
jgi:cell division protein FtsB